MQWFGILETMRVILAEMDDPPHLLCGDGWLIAASGVRAFGVHAPGVIRGRGVITGAALAHIIECVRGNTLLTLRLSSDNEEVAVHLGEFLTIIRNRVSIKARRKVADFLALKQRARVVASDMMLPLLLDDHDASRGAVVLRDARFVDATDDDDLAYDRALLRLGLHALRGQAVTAAQDGRGVLFLSAQDDAMFFALAPSAREEGER